MTETRGRPISRKMPKGLQLAVEAAGSISALARKLGISPQAISQWDDIPIRQIVAIERATRIDRTVLRPGMYQQRRKR